MIREIRFENFKVLRHSTLPLGRFTLLLGPNGSGKSTIFRALEAVRSPGGLAYGGAISVGVTPTAAALPNSQVTVSWGEPHEGYHTLVSWYPDQQGQRSLRATGAGGVVPHVQSELEREMEGIRTYSLDASQVAADVAIQPSIELAPNGFGLAGVLDRLDDNHRERFEGLNAELGRWLPEFDRILLEVPYSGAKRFLLRTREGHHKIPATELSQGTLLALAMLTVAHLPTPPSIVCFEEPDRGIHPRLLRDVRDALYRLSHPESVGERRPPVQVIATTHSPYLLDLFREHPEEIVLARRSGFNVTFERLSDREDLEELLREAHLGDLWYTGILGGVPGEK